MNYGDFNIWLSRMQPQFEAAATEGTPKRFIFFAKTASIFEL